MGPQSHNRVLVSAVERSRDSLFAVGKQLAAVYAASWLLKESRDYKQYVWLLPFRLRWGTAWATAPRTGVAQTPTVTKWEACLEQLARFSKSPLSQELQQVLDQ